MAELSMEERLCRVEREVALIKRRLLFGGDKSNWVKALIGTAHRDPDYEEICRLGKEIRDAEPPPGEER